MKLDIVKVIKKDESMEVFDTNKIVRAINKTALRCNIEISTRQHDDIIKSSGESGKGNKRGRGVKW